MYTMSTRSGIEWTETTWNSRHGVLQDQPGVRALLRRAHGAASAVHGGGTSTGADSMSRCTRRRSTNRYVGGSRGWCSSIQCPICSMHPWPAPFIESVFAIMNRAARHTFQVLTKRPERVMQLDTRLALDAQHLARRQHRIGAVAGSAGAVGGQLAPGRSSCRSNRCSAPCRGWIWTASTG